ncbi:hypothetical protein HAQ00_02375 [Acidithiobacillus caldus ATCC 51756]|jgi:hypothetical protein|uniref:TraU family protein n=1 Tax=Acidithiobacillus caldus TaxID=33059 RepID=UPI001C078EC0|nr:TraU family protein [Acidithiobacillus caldus]MBU2734591.1 hypothetical protein [Acidithiobacillus caldus ATCC 51756]MBU2801336.1 hypothetical protein [Acidithiobacillus caldus]
MRKRLQRLLVACAATMLSCAQPMVAHAFSLEGAINWGSCAKPAIVGLCGPIIPIGYVVSEWLPTTYTGTVKAPGEFNLPGVGSIAAGIFGQVLGHVSQVSENGTDNTFVVHVWGLTNQILALSSGTLSCFGCQLNAIQGLVYNANSGGNEPIKTPTCGDTSVAETAGIHALDAAFRVIPMMPIPEYFSELDMLNWRTGCRDLSITKMLRSNAFTCGAENATRGVDGLSKKIQGIVGKDACIGSWGPLYPRQMRDIGPTTTIASAVEAYRGMSEAATVFHTMSAPLNLQGKMQEAYPHVSGCFKVGTSIKKVTKMTKGSHSGNYGWVYWVHTTCCVPFTRYESCIARMAK